MDQEPTAFKKSEGIGVFNLAFSARISIGKKNTGKYQKLLIHDVSSINASFLFPLKQLVFVAVFVVCLFCILTFHLGFRVVNVHCWGQCEESRRDSILKPVIHPKGRM